MLFEGGKILHGFGLAVKIFGHLYPVYIIYNFPFSQNLYGLLNCITIVSRL